MSKYESDENLEWRIGNLRYCGHDSSVWGEKDPPRKGHVVEISDPCLVSKPCWSEICEAADLIDTITLDLNKFVNWETDAEHADVHQFFFCNIDTAKQMALRVQRSARNIRKDDVRQIRLDEAGGFHNKGVLEQLFEIQQGCCYYSGDPLIKRPKNFVVDHIRSIYKGGTDWPNNLALAIKEINTWKGGHTSPAETLKWLARQRGQSWLRKQKAYCKDVDKRREELDLKFRQLASKRRLDGVKQPA